MAVKTVDGSKNLASEIKKRRLDLGMTIEEAAMKAGVGIKTWCRYEAGESIRNDKYMGVCKALNWRSFPGEKDTSGGEEKIRGYKDSPFWSKDIEQCYGEEAALSFVIGSDILLDDLSQDLAALSSKPRGTHIGELDCSFIADQMPEQFLIRYDYEFMYQMQVELNTMRTYAQNDIHIVAHSVLQELILYLIIVEAEVLMDDMSLGGNWNEWIFDEFDDDDIVMMLYSGRFVTEDDIYHFEHWTDKTFYM